MEAFIDFISHHSGLELTCTSVGKESWSEIEDFGHEKHTPLFPFLTNTLSSVWINYTYALSKALQYAEGEILWWENAVNLLNKLTISYQLIAYFVSQSLQASKASNTILERSCVAYGPPENVGQFLNS